MQLQHVLNVLNIATWVAKVILEWSEEKEVQRDHLIQIKREIIRVEHSLKTRSVATRGLIEWVNMATREHNSICDELDRLQPERIKLAAALETSSLTGDVRQALNQLDGVIEEKYTLVHGYVELIGGAKQLISINSSSMRRFADGG